MVAGVVQGDVGAILTANFGLFGYLVVYLALCAHLAVGLTGIAIVANQLVGVLAVDGRYIVDIE